MWGILYNKQTKKIVNIFQDPELNGNKIKDKEKTVIFGDGLGVVFVSDNTVKVETINEIEVFTPEIIDSLILETPPKTLEDRIKDLEKGVKELKNKVKEKL